MKKHNEYTSLNISRLLMAGRGKCVALSFAVMLLGIQTCYATGPIKAANQQLRTLFENLSNPNSDVLFLYQMGAHVIDADYFSENSSLTSDADAWLYAYKELTWCAYDTTWMESDSSVYARACDVYADTVTIGVIDYYYNSLKPTSLTTDTYFYFDTINNQLSSKNVDQSPAYNVQEIFMSSPLLRTSQTQSVVFKTSPAFIFADQTIWDDWEGVYELYIDFDDGAGFVQIDPFHTTYHSINYTTPGLKTLTTMVSPAGDREHPIKTSLSHFVVNATPYVDPQEYTDLSDEFEGLMVYQFDPLCDNGLEDDKIIFILPGYNALSFCKYFTRSVSNLYSRYIVDGHREILRRFGYTFVLVEWDNVNAPIEQNGDMFTAVLEYYKCHATGDEQFVVIGESMGALIGRYALALMESSHYINQNDCKEGTMHNVRLFISNDGPHLGANIPLSIQEAYAAAITDPLLGEIHDDILNAATLGFIDFRWRAINGPSVQEMLLYHYSTRQLNHYTAHPIRQQFLSNLAYVGDHPRYCKTMALSNGSLLGYPQQNCFDSLDAGTFRSANDYLVRLDASIDFKVLGVPFSVGSYFDLQTNPNGSGQLAYIYSGVRLPVIKLRWFRIDVTFGPLATAGINRYGEGLQPYCTSAGGAVWLNQNHGGYFGDLPSFSVGNALLGINLTMNPGLIHFEHSLDIPWLFGVTSSLTFETNGAGFCLVPVQSALCYSPNNWNLGRDYTALTSTTIFNNTWFDVISGHTDEDAPYRYNGLHITYRNNVFVNQITSDTTYHYIDPLIPTRILNREVGDEELFLDNMTIFNDASYSALMYIYVNEEHPYYNFDGQTNTTYKIPGMYCRHDNTTPFNIQTGTAYFHVGEDLVLTYINGEYEKIPESYSVCDDYQQNAPGAKALDKETMLLGESLYPNPAHIGEPIFIATTQNVESASLCTLTGEHISENSVDNSRSGFATLTISSVIPTGLYMLWVRFEDGSMDAYKLFIN